MITRSRILRLLLIFLAITPILLLVSGLPDINLEAGKPFFFQRENETADFKNLPFKLWSFTNLWNILGAILLWVFLPLSIIYFIISPEARKQAIKRAMALSLAFYGMFILLRQCSQLNPESVFNPNILSDAVSLADESVEAIFQTNTPQWMIILLDILITTLFIGLLLYILHRMRLAASTIDQLGIEARVALESIHAGVDIKDTILRCYYDMNKILTKHRGISRKQAMTPREFEKQLANLGLPEEHINRLTRLFEEVRYGTIELGVQQEQEAIICLTAIVKACEPSS
jgi:hypothetical protein